MKAPIVPDIDGDLGHQPGAIEFRQSYGGGSKIAGIGFRCPCGCGGEGYLPVRPKGMARRETPEWEFDGNLTAPTLHPSVFNSSWPCRWHGWLRNGEWVKA